MKKLFMIMTLFISSFFLFNNNVKADVTISEDVNMYINDDFFIKRDYVIQYANENNYHYVFYYDKNYAFPYYVYLYDKNLTATSDGIRINLPTGHSKRFKSNTAFQNISSPSSYYIDFSYPILDMSQDIYSTTQFFIIYNDLTYTVDESNKFVTYYDIYNDLNNIVEKDPYEEEKEKINNFYSILIEKISYLADEFSNNYILLSIIGIFLVILIFELVFRRYL